MKIRLPIIAMAVSLFAAAGTVNQANAVSSPPGLAGRCLQRLPAADDFSIRNRAVAQVTCKNRANPVKPLIFIKNCY